MYGKIKKQVLRFKTYKTVQVFLSFHTDATSQKYSGNSLANSILPQNIGGQNIDNKHLPYGGAKEQQRRHSRTNKARKNRKRKKSQLKSLLRIFLMQISYCIFIFLIIIVRWNFWQSISLTCFMCKIYTMMELIDFHLAL